MKLTLYAELLVTFIFFSDRPVQCDGFKQRRGVSEEGFQVSEIKGQNLHDAPPHP